MQNDKFQMPPPRIALVHDSLTQLGGAERVVDALHELFPKAAVYTLVLDWRLQAKYNNWNIQVTWLQTFYNLLPKLQYWIFLIPWAVASIKIPEVDIIISSSSGFVKNIRVPKNCLHINYCHTPARFLWINREYINQEVPFLFKPIVQVFLKWMKKWDLEGTARIGLFAANSEEVKKRITAVYKREATVVYPPINTDFWTPTATKGKYFLIAGRLQAHKKIDFVIECFNELGLPLHVAGTGRQEKYLRGLAKANIKFLGQITDAALRDEYSGAQALIYPQVEDFGLMPLEAAACGTPTIAFQSGGSLETVKAGITGEFFSSYVDHSFKQIVTQWQSNKYQSERLKSHAREFNTQKFKQLFLEFVNRSYENRN